MTERLLSGRIGLVHDLVRRIGVPPTTRPLAGREPTFVAGQPIYGPWYDGARDRKATVPAEFIRVEETENWSCRVRQIGVVVRNWLVWGRGSKAEKWLNDGYLGSAGAVTPNGHANGVGRAKGAESTLPSGGSGGFAEQAERWPGGAHLCHLSTHYGGRGAKRITWPKIAIHRISRGEQLTDVQNAEADRRAQATPRGSGVTWEARRGSSWVTSRRAASFSPVLGDAVGAGSTKASTERKGDALPVL